MKANGVPEKLYFGESDKGILDIYSTKESDNEVEYTRTDSFIKKVCDAYCKACNKPPYSVPIPFCRRRCESYNNFVKNIKL